MFSVSQRVRKACANELTPLWSYNEDNEECREDFKRCSVSFTRDKIRRKSINPAHYHDVWIRQHLDTDGKCSSCKSNLIFKYICLDGNLQQHFLFEDDQVYWFFFFFSPPAMNHFHCGSDKVNVSSTVQRGTLRGGTGSRKTSTSKNWPSWYSRTSTTWTTSTSSQTNVPSSKRRWSRSARSRSKVRIRWASLCGLMMIITAPSSPTRAAYTITLYTHPDSGWCILIYCRFTSEDEASVVLST